jgi:hypothetical protein
MRQDGRIVGGEEWQEKLYNREEWKKNDKESLHSAHVNEVNHNAALCWCLVT